MVILIIDKLGVGADKPEGDTPVPVDPNRPVAFQITLQRVQLEGRQVHVIRPCRDIEQAENVSELLHMGSLNALRRAGAIEGFKSLVPKSDYHDVGCIALRYKTQASGRQRRTFGALTFDEPPVKQLATLELHLGDCLADVHPAKSVASTKLDENALHPILVNARRA